jgi:molecular chaperone DnaK (HSP70)
MTKEETLLKMKEKIEKDKNDKAKLEGELNASLQQLNKLDCKDKKQAENMIKKLDKEIKEEEIQFENKFKELQEKYQWT